MQESFSDRGEVAPAKRALIHDILTSAVDTVDKPRRDPVEHWKGVLNTKGLPDISYRYAREALAIIEPRRERQPGEDWEEDSVA